MKKAHKYLSSKIGKINVSVELLKDESKMLIEVPGCNFLKDESIKASFIYDPFDGTNYGLGNGMKLNHQIKIESSGNNYVVSYPNGNVITLNGLGNNVYQSNDKQLKLQVESNQYRLYDKYGNYYEWNTLNQVLPSKMKLRNNTTIEFTSSSYGYGFVFENYSGDSAFCNTYSQDMNIFYYQRRYGHDYRIVTLTYQNGSLDEVIYKTKDNKVIASYKFIKNGNSITIQDVINHSSVKYEYEIVSGKRRLISVSSNPTANNYEEYELKTTYTYQTVEGCHIVTETFFNGRKQKYYLDNSNNLIQVDTINNEVSRFSYDSLNYIDKVVKSFLFKDCCYQLLSQTTKTAAIEFDYNGAYADLFTKINRFTIKQGYYKRTSMKTIPANTPITFGFYLRSKGVMNVTAEITANNKIIYEEVINPSSTFSLYAIDIKQKYDINSLSIKLKSNDPTVINTYWEVSPVYCYVGHSNEVYHYDENYNLLCVENEHTEYYHYNNDNKIIDSTNPTSDIQSITYDDLGRITYIRYANGNQERYTYYANSNRPVSIGKMIGDEFFKETCTYNEYLQPLTHKNIDGNTLRYYYDEDCDLIMIENDNNQKISFIYDDYGLIKEVKHHDDQFESIVTTDYEDGLVSRVHSNNLNYDYMYNLDNTINMINCGLYNDSYSLVQYQYGLTNGKNCGLVDEKCENNDFYCFDYDQYGENLVRQTLNNKITEYQYGPLNELLKEENEDETKEYYYELGYRRKTLERNNQQVQTNEQTLFGKGIIETSRIGNESIINQYDSIDRVNNCLHNVFFKRYKTTNNLSCFFNELNQLSFSTDLTNYNTEINAIKPTFIQNNVNRRKATLSVSDGQLPLTYRVGSNNSSNFNIFLGASFKIGNRLSNAGKTLINCLMGGRDRIKVTFYDKKLKLEVYKNNSLIMNLISQEFSLFSFHTVGVNVYVDDGTLYCDLYLDNDCTHGQTSDYILTSHNEEYALSYGCSVDILNLIEEDTSITGEIGTLVYGEKNSEEDIYAFTTNSRIILDELSSLSDDECTFNSRVINYDDILDSTSSGKFYPLNGSFSSTSNDRPKELDLGYLEDEALGFTYIPLKRKYVYKLGRVKVKYPIDSDSGLIMAKVNIEKAGVIFNLNNNLKLIVDDNRSLVAIINGVSHNLGLSFSTSSDSVVLLEYTKITTNESSPNIEYQIRVMCDFENLPVTITYESNIILNSLDLQEESIGTIESLYISDVYHSIESINNLFSKMNSITKERDYYEDGRIKSEKITKNNRLAHSITYNYKTSTENDSTIQTSVISSICNTKTGSTDELTFDEKGNLSRLTNTTEQKDLVYTYDYLDRITQVNNMINGEYYRYEYDANSNISLIEHKPSQTQNSKITLFEYDRWPQNAIVSMTKDGITYRYRYNNECLLSRIEYESNDTLKQILLDYEGSKLISYIDENKTVTYTYDNRGRRIKKLVGTNEETMYYYNNDLLVMEIKGTNKIQYLYDENKLLYGFKHNGDVYFYDKDITGQINGIYCIDGGTVVKYKYSPYGELISITGSHANTIGVLNHMLYKGYYYGEETQLYWVSSRYYSPELCRWISPDSIEYLDPQSINGLNLYAYCGNDPVNKYDPSGHFPWLILAAVMLFTPVGGTITQAAVSTLGYVTAAGWALGDLIFNGGKGAWADMCSINWNPFNADEDKVMNSNYLSFYKGVPVLQISGMGGSMSLGLIFFDKSQESKVLKHERGHNNQLMSMGLGNYLIQIGIPSVWKNGDETPWELSASMLGGSALANGYSEEQKREAYNYYIRARFPIINIYNIFKYIFY